ARLEPGSYSTAGARWQLYRDAWRQIAEAPWLGHGADAWRRHVGQLQRMPYVSMEVHSGYLNQLLELGAVGLTLLAGLLAQLLRRVWQAQRLATLPLLALLLHAAIDFDMSYGLYWLLLFGFAAQGIAGRGRAVPGEGGGMPVGGSAEQGKCIVTQRRGSSAQGQGRAGQGWGSAAPGEGRGVGQGSPMQGRGGAAAAAR
ncbi:O-antigen ligase family protein, partial [Paenibacillus sp. 598K]|uniref:O-antigen ligase family protein n=1 Tax=Paenibacillus sp. 598K TaxID=1117987 RepID=UPI001629CB9F